VSRTPLPCNSERLERDDPALIPRAAERYRIVPSIRANIEHQIDLMKRKQSLNLRVRDCCD
jgi:hypothetical protein